MAKMRQKGSTKDLGRKVEKRLISALNRAGTMLVADMQESIKSGSVSGAGHIPSRPGQPPNANTHRLDSGISYSVTRTPAGAMRLKVVTAAVYARYLEYGTRRMAPRPFMRPALARNREAIIESINSIQEHAKK